LHFIILLFTNLSLLIFLNGNLNTCDINSTHIVDTLCHTLNVEARADDMFGPVLMRCTVADSGGTQRRLTDELQINVQEALEARGNEGPCAHVLRLFLAPHELHHVTVLEHFLLKFFGRERRQFFDTNQRDFLFRISLLSLVQQFVEDFPRAENDLLNSIVELDSSSICLCDTYLMESALVSEKTDWKRVPGAISSRVDEAMGSRNKVLGPITTKGLRKLRFI
jgi:hypothetical protein